MKPIKAWAIVETDGSLRRGWELYSIHQRRWSARRGAQQGRVIRVEIRELPTKARKK